MTSSTKSCKEFPNITFESDTFQIQVKKTMHSSDSFFPTGSWIGVGKIFSGYLEDFEGFWRFLEVFGWETDKNLL